MFAMMKKFWKEEAGASAVEYALMVALFAVVIIVAIRALNTPASVQAPPVAVEIDSVVP